MAAEYCSVQEVSDFLQVQHDTAQALDGDAASAQKVVPVASTRRYVVGMTVWIYDDDNPDGEEDTIASIQDETSITLTSNLANSYTTAQNAAVQALIGFTNATRPSYNTVVKRIEETQEVIDAFCHTTWLSAGKTITDEYHDYRPATDRFGRHRDYSDRGRTYARFRPANSWTKIEVYDGSNYIDVVADKVEGRNNDYWTEDDKGIVHFANYYPYRIRRAIRLTYVYGHSSIPQDIRNVCLNMVAADLIKYEDESMHLAEGAEGISHDRKYEFTRQDAYQLMYAHRESYIHD